MARLRLPQHVQANNNIATRDALEAELHTLRAQIQKSSSELSNVKKQLIASTEQLRGVDAQLLVQTKRLQRSRAEEHCLKSKLVELEVTTDNARSAALLDLAKGTAALEKLTTKSALVEGRFLQLKDEAKAAEIELQNLQLQVKAATDDSNLTIKQFRDKIALLRIEASEAEERKQRTLQELESQIQAKEQELQKATNEVTDALKSVKDPSMALAREIKIFETKKRDLDIYANKVHARWRIVFPDREMKF